MMHGAYNVKLTSLAVVANQPLDQCVPSVLHPRNEVAGRNADNPHPARGQELVEPYHFHPVRLHGAVRNAKPSDTSALTSLLHNRPVSFDSAGDVVILLQEREVRR